MKKKRSLLFWIVYWFLFPCLRLHDLIYNDIFDYYDSKFSKDEKEDC